MGPFARFSFHALTIPLIFSTIAIAVTIESIGNYWFVIVGAMAVMGMSYVVATLLRYVVGVPYNQDFNALRIAATFPNIVALPILIFPSLCEFPVVYENYVLDPETEESNSLQQQCVAQSNTMIFCYFFSWSFIFWSLGNRQLMMAATKRHDEVVKSNEEQNATFRSKDDLSSIKDAEQDERGCTMSEDANNTLVPDANQDESDNTRANLDDTLELQEKPAVNPAVATSSDQHEHSIGLCESFWIAAKQTVTSAGFIAMVAAFITACIPPLQKALFETGGPLRFLGSAVETLGIASSPISTMVVAASLVPPRRQEPEDISSTINLTDTQERGIQRIDENPAMSDPNFGPYRRQPRRSARLDKIRRSLRSSSMRIIQAMPRSKPEMIRLHLWFCASTLVLNPAVIVGLVLALDCSGNLLSGVPNLAKLVLIINSSLPGALIVIVLLKSREEMSETAAVVAKVYLPCYLLSIVTIAAWTAVALWVTLPDENGLTLCQR